MWQGVSSTFGLSQYDPIDDSARSGERNTLVNVLRLLYRIVLWCALIYLSLVDIVAAVNQSVGVWIKVAIVLLMFMACSASLLLAHQVLSSGTILVRC